MNDYTPDNAIIGRGQDLIDDDGGYPVTGTECDRCGSDYRTGTAYGRTLCRPCQAEEAEQ